MKATIRSHKPLPADHPEIHRFTFELDDGGHTVPYTETVSLRTARVLVTHLEDGNAFIKMLRAIVQTDMADYDSLVGRMYKDKFVDDGLSNRTSGENSEPSANV